eukprot:superscaffoldBa00000777_g7150
MLTRHLWTSACILFPPGDRGWYKLLIGVRRHDQDKQKERRERDFQEAPAIKHRRQEYFGDSTGLCIDKPHSALAGSNPTVPSAVHPAGQSQAASHRLPFHSSTTRLKLPAFVIKLLNRSASPRNRSIGFGAPLHDTERPGHRLVMPANGRNR